LVVPGVPGGRPPPVAELGADWYVAWLALPDEERGHMRTYTVRDVVGQGVDTRLVVDIVVHPDGEPGPGCAWAERASAGDRVVLVAPRRGHDFGGIEFLPGAAGRLLLAGDETAVPAVCAILGQLPPDARGAAFLEVPTSADVQAVPHPDGVSVVWLARDGAELGSLLHAAVVGHLGGTPADAQALEEVDPDLWETPSYSSSGEDLAGGPTDRYADLYAWIAGESAVVTGLRRALVRDLGIGRRQVAFMGYWRRGVSMRG
jgi:NADPH-dependent ferric siderophore reductase